MEIRINLDDVYFDNILQGKVNEIFPNYPELEEDLLVLRKNQMIIKINQIAGQQLAFVIHPYSELEAMGWENKLTEAKKLTEAIASSNFTDASEQEKLEMISNLLNTAPNLTEEAVSRNRLAIDATEEQKLVAATKLANAVIENSSKNSAKNHIIGLRGYYVDKIKAMTSLKEIMEYKEYLTGW